MRGYIAIAAAALAGGVLAASSVGAAAQTEASAGETQKFDCYAATPRSAWYDSGDYAQAFAEIEPMARTGCASAEHLLAVMYAKGQGVRQDPVSAYAWLLASFSMGATPFGGPQPTALGDDPNEFEIVQYGARLSNDEIAEAERMVSRLVSPHAIAANGAVGPTGIHDAIEELRQRGANYRLNGRVARLASDNPAASRLGAQGTVLAQLVTAENSNAAPHQLLFIEAKIRDQRDRADAAQDLQRELDLAASEGERFQNLALGTEVRIVRFGVNAGFASQVEPFPAETSGQKYWVDNCLLKMKDPRDETLLRAARSDQCERRSD
ncbi:MAG: sel1 repeat family protein [Bradyrhizobium sp.]|nr:MAG: sel1 repeat family protein [Bradyrhizobium sp.]